MWLFFAFLAVPLIEIGLFIQVGGAIGLWPTLAIVVITAILGTTLVRSQGLMAIQNLQKSFSELQDPTNALAHGALILISGALLLTPGFFTDALGFSFLIQPIRNWIINSMRNRINVQSFTMGGPSSPASGRGFDGADIIDGDFEELKPANNPNQATDGLTKH